MRGELYLERISRKRRKRELIRIILMIFMSSVFLSASLLVQGHMQGYQREAAFKLYGRWIFREKKPTAENSPCRHPYLRKSGVMTAAGPLYGKGQKSKIIEDDIGYYLGSMDDAAVKMGNIRLYEGKFPEGEDEIAVEVGVLEKLGYSSELGQRLTFTYGEKIDTTALILEDKEQKYCTREYTLVGIMGNYTAQWNEGGVLPGAIVSETALAKLPGQRQGYQFYQLKEMYGKIDIPSFCNGILNVGGEGGSPKREKPVYNEFVYGQQVWGSTGTYRMITFLLFFLGTAALTYMIVSYQKRRKGYYYRLRSIGATAGQVRKMAAFEIAATSFPSACAGIALSYGGCALIVYQIARRRQYQNFYNFSWPVFAGVCLCVFLTILTAVVFSQFFLSARRIQGKEKNLSERQIRALRRRSRRLEKKKSFRIGAGEILWRKRRMKWLQTWLIRLLGIVVCTLVLFCLARISQERATYQYVKDDNADFYYSLCGNWRIEDTQAENPAERVIESGIGTLLKRVLSPEKERQVENISGIRTLLWRTADASHSVDWEGREESPLFREYLKDIGWPEGKEELAYRNLYDTCFYQKPEYVWELCRSKITWEGADYKEFAAGRQVIVFFGGDSVDYKEIMGKNYVNDSLRPGMDIRIRTEGEDVSARVAAVLNADEIYHGGEFAGGFYSFVGSDALGKKIAEQDGNAYGHNLLRIWKEPSADPIDIERQLYAYLDEGNDELTSDFEEIALYQKKYFTAVRIYGFFAVVLLSVFLLIRGFMILDEKEHGAKEMEQLAQMGMEQKALRNMQLQQGCSEGLWYLLSVFPAVFVIGGSIWSELALDERRDPGRLTSYVSYFFRKVFPYTNKGKMVVCRMLDYINPVWCGTFLLGMLAVIIVMQWGIGRGQKRDAGNRRRQPEVPAERRGAI